MPLRFVGPQGAEASVIIENNRMINIVGVRKGTVTLERDEKRNRNSAKTC